MKNVISTFIVAVLMIAIFVSGIIVGEQEAPTTEEIVREALDEMKILEGSKLRGMMNEAKYSPGLAQEFTIEYPTYAYLFDGSFIEYIDK